MGLLFGLVASVLTTGITLIFVAAKGYALTVSWATILRFAAGAVLGSGLLAAVGMGVGSVIRGQLAAVVAVFLWGAIVEPVLGGLVNSTQPYLPFTAAGTMAGSALGGGTTPLPFLAAAALVAAVAIVISGVAARTTVKADIS